MKKNNETERNDTRTAGNRPNRSDQQPRVKDKIDRDLEHSFPASDPPGWTLGIGREFY